MDSFMLADDSQNSSSENRIDPTLQEMVPKRPSAQNYTDVDKWVCSCYYFKISCFYLCKHLVLLSKEYPKFRSQIEIQDYYPFIIFIKGSDNSVIQSYSLEIIPTNNDLELTSADNGNTVEAAILKEDKEAAITHSKIAVLMDFLKKELDQHQNNLRQLKVMQSSLKDAFQYMHDVETYINSKELPQTWSDLNKNTMFH